MFVRVKYTRNGLNTAKDLKNKTPSFDETMSKTQNVLLAAKRCRKPKRPLAAKRFECKTPFEFDIAFAVFIPLRVCVWPFCVYIPFWPLWPPISLLTCTCTPLWVFSVHEHASPYGIFGRFADE